MFLKHNDIGIGEGAIFSIVAILLVFTVLILIIIFVWSLSKVKFKEEVVAKKVFKSVDKKLSIDDIEDEDMMVAALVATAEFVEETKEKDARLVSIKKLG